MIHRLLAKRRHAVAAFLLTLSALGYASTVDLSVSAYTWSPDPVIHGGTSTFSVTVTNNDVVSAASGLTLAIDLPSNVDFSSSPSPSGCTFNLGASPKTLTCTNATLAPSGTWNVNFDGAGLTPGTQNTTATITASGNVDPNGGNDVLTKTTTVISGADLTVALTGLAMPGTCTACTATAGSTQSFAINVTNNGPDPATTFQVVTNLPAAIDFTYQSATGTGWACSASGTTLTCNYSGSSVASGASAPQITLTGRIITVSGSITLGSAVSSTDASVGDPVAANNGPSQVIVTVTPGTDLRANKTMVSAVTGLTSVTNGESVTLTLSATNTGTQAATGVTIGDVVPADFSIGTLPGGCSALSQTITCTVGSLAAGATSSSFTIPLTTVGTAGSSGANTATVARTGPAGGNNTSANVNYTIVAPFAHLTLTKAKGPTPVAAGATITNTIVVTNASSSTSAATGTIRVTDALGANETFVSSSPASWSCSASGSPETVTCDYAGANLARGASLPTLTITTQAAGGFLGTLSNTACTGLSAGSPHTPADNSSTGNCATRSVTATPRNVDLGIAKTATPASPTHVLATDSSFTYTLDVTNAGPDTAPTVQVSDTLAAWHTAGSSPATTGSAAITVNAGPSDACTFGQTVSCSLINLASGETRTILITVNRPVLSGTINNTATVSTPDAIDTNAGNNSASASIIIDAVADVAVTSIANSPEPVKVGVQMTYTTSIKNNGPSTAQGVVLRHTIDATRMTYVAGSAALTSGGTCSYTTFSGAPFAGQTGIECTGFSLTDGQSGQLTFKVIPVYPYPDALAASYTSQASVTTTTYESDSPTYANNTASNTATVNLQTLDLSVTDNDPGYDPVAFGDAIVYQVRAQNNGPSQATGFQLSVTPNAPAGGSPSAYTMAYNAGGSVLPGGASCSQPGGLGTAVICWMGASRAASVLAAGASQTFNLKFDTGPLVDAPASSITYSTTAAVTSYEADSGFDSLPGNNAISETTTVLPKTDLLMVSKAVSKPVVDLNEPFTYTLTAGNKGPSDASSVVISDALPAGFVMTAPATATASGFALAINSCSSPAVGSGGTVTCTVGPIPTDATGADTSKQVVISIPVRAAYQASGTYSFAFNTNVANSGTLTPSPNTSIDPDGSNNTASVNVQVRKNSVAGFVYADNDLNDAMNPAGTEGINSVTLTLTGTDSYGYTYGPSSTYAALTKTTSGSGATTGSFLFDNLPPGTWTLVETQPSGYYDRFETAGTAGGTVPANTCDGTTNCASSAAANTISGVALPANTATAATDYLFQEYRQATLSGTVYVDANNDGVKAGGESGIASVTVAVTGTAYNGTAVSTNATTSGTGTYSVNLPPSNGSGYTVTETQPASHLPGKTTAGTASGTGSAAGTVPSLYGNVIQAVVLGSNGASPNNNFGELAPASIAGAVFIDANTNAAKDGGETTGVSGVTLTLTGTDDQGNSVNTTTTSGVAGAYSFTNLRPGTYTVTETPLPGLTHTGAQAGSLGGSGQPSGTAMPGAGVVTITAITVASGNAGTGYNFGESGQGLSGNVYVDLNNNGVMDVGEPGIAGVQVTLSGTAASGNSVCVEISPNPCVVTTNASGAYNFLALPASNGAGYTLTEQSQASAPLSNYTDGTDAAGSLGGATGNDVLSGIVIGLGQVGTNYNFGERAASLSGSVYLDVNNNGANDAGDTPLSGVTITLSGTTASGANVCTVTGVNCTTTTDASGNFSYVGLPKANGSGYTLTETQPSDYVDRSNAAGTAGGSVAVANVISGITLNAGASGTGYLFGEKTGSISGNVYHDANNDGSKGGGESGIGSVTLTLTGTSASGAAVSATTTTAADGSYSFSGLKNANGAGYTITETQPAAYLDGKLSKGLVNGVTCAACNTAVANVISAIPFVASSTFTAFDFGEVQAAGLAGKVYLDLNDNGSMDGADTGIAGVTVTLTGTDDQGTAVNVAVTSDASGNFNFTNLRPSNVAGYTVTETQPADYIDRSNTAGTAGGTAGSNAFTGVVIASGASASGYLFGEKGGALSGYVYYDANNDGSKAASGEPGIASVTLTLSGTSASGAAVSATTTTAADGSYSFTGLKNSNGSGYTITETQPSAYLDGKLSKGLVNGSTCAACNTTVANVISAVSFSATNTYTAFNFGELQGASIAGTVYIDANNNGAQDSGEAGIAGVVLSLTGIDDLGATVTRTATTAADGSYTFSALRPSNGAGYTITETQPAGYLDGRETTGTGTTTAGTVDNTAFDSTSAHNRITGIVLAPGQSGVSYLFGEQGGTLAGNVYVDGYTGATINGSKDAGEPGLPNVRIYLSGTTAGGSNVCSIIASCTATTDGTGAFSFVVPPGTYTLIEEQADVRSFLDTATSTTRNLSDARETAGVAGGTVDNSGFGNNVGYNTISNILVDAGTMAANAGNMGGYLFGERLAAGAVGGVVPPIVSGYVYLDTTHTRVRGTAAADTRVAGWTATLTATRSDGSTETICSVQTDATGYYHLDNVSCAAAFPQWAAGLPISGQASPSAPSLTYTTFAVSFSDPGVNGAGIVTVPQSGGGAGTADSIRRSITGITLRAGDVITEQNLPLDPSGVVYDAVTRAPVGNAVVTLLEGGAPVDTNCLVSGQNPVTTGSNGFYQFLIQIGGACAMAPGAHTFTIAVTPPSGYAPGVSTMIPPTTGPYIPPTLGGVVTVQAQSTPPSGAQPTTYYLSLTLTLTASAATSSSSVVNNHIPIDPVSAGLILVTKTTPLLNVARGDLVPYTVTATNNVAMTVANINLVDLIPPGFRYRSGSAVLNGVPSEPTVTGRNLSWRGLSFAPNERKTWKMILVVGAGVGDGEYVNQAWAASNLTGGLESNQASATVRVVPDPNFDCSDIIGKVFDDQNANGYQDQGEPGIANVRIATPRGLLVTTDSEGRFHVTCADVPNQDRGSNFVMKLDERTLPSGYRVTTENPRDVRLTRGKMVKLNFGATVHRVVRLELNGAAFTGEGVELAPEWSKQLEAVPAQLKGRPSVLRIAYRTDKDSPELARKRLDAVAGRIRELWKQQDTKDEEKRNPLVIETELEGAK